MSSPPGVHQSKDVEYLLLLLAITHLVSIIQYFIEV